MNNKSKILILFLIVITIFILLIVSQLTFKKEVVAPTIEKSDNKSTTTTNFKGPTGPPKIIGPTSPPPGQ